MLNARLACKMDMPMNMEGEEEEAELDRLVESW